MAVALALNWIYQVARKPAELFFPVSGVLTKTPAETWRQYEAIFREHSTAVMTPALLAALAQIEGAGDPLARTPWRLRASADPRAIYRPASSAVGMYQITDGTFREAKRTCIHDHVAVEEGCWFNSLYLRVIPSHAVEMTSAYLDRRVAQALERQRIARATLEQKQDLAALMHLCGAGAGEAYAKRGFRLASGQRCGEHDAQAYLAQVRALKRVFARYATFG
ncbi:MAG: transglycosylase SLT domain-containing protein [Burkholderiales bacterium]